MSPMPEKPYELIMAQDFVQQLGKELGSRHPAFGYLAYDIQLAKADAPIGLRELVKDNWVWHLSYPFHILSRLANADEAHPVCWIKRDQICRIRLATSEVFGYEPERMDRKFIDIGRSWEAAYDAMLDDGSLRLVPPPGLGKYWFGMLLWRTTDDGERQRLFTPILPEFTWIPLYRYIDLLRISTIISNEVTAASPFGNKPIREISGEVSRLRAKYGIQLSKLPRTYRGSKTAEFCKHRRDILRRLQSAGYSLTRIILKFGDWTSLAAELRDVMESQPSDTEAVRRIARERRTPDLVIEMVRSLLDRYPAEDVDASIFGRDERTLRRDWKSLSE